MTGKKIEFEDLESIIAYSDMRDGYYQAYSYDQKTFCVIKVDSGAYEFDGTGIFITAEVLKSGYVLTERLENWEKRVSQNDNQIIKKI